MLELDYSPGVPVPSEPNRDPHTSIADRARNAPAFSYWLGLTMVAAASLGVLVLLAILVNPLTSVLAGVIVVALGVTMTGASRGRRLPREFLFFAGLALIPLLIALTLIVIVT